LAYRLFLTLLVFSPLAFGTTELWSLVLVQVGILLSCLLVLRAGAGGRIPLYRPPGLTPLVALAGFMLLQTIPLPPALLQWISLETWQLYRDSIWVVRPDLWMPLSVAPSATMAQFFRLSAGIACYLLAVQFMSDPQRRKQALTLLSAFAGLYALFGILQFFFPGERILWVLKSWPERTAHAFATYVNGNHYAGLMEMILPVVLTWFFAIRPSVRYGSWRENFVEFLQHPRVNAYILTGLSVTLIGVSIFFSLSRGGILSTLGSLGLLGLLFLFRRDNRKTGGLIVLFVGLLLCAVGFLGWDPILERFDRIRDQEGNITDQRPVYWQDSAGIIRDFPVLGSGFGTFVHIYPRYQTIDTGKFFVDHAHNDYVELLTDGGCVGALLVSCFLATLGVAGFRSLRRRKNQASIFLALGSFAGMAALGLHSYTDFNFYIGANGLYFFFIAGLWTASAHGRSREVSGHWSELKIWKNLPVRFALVAGATVLPAALIVGGANLFAQGQISGYSRSDLAGEGEAARFGEIGKSLDRAMRWDPLQADYRRAAARLDLALGKPDAALDRLVEALRLAPVDGQSLEQLALLLDQKGDKARAELLLRTAARNDRSNSERIRAYAAWLLKEGRQDEAFREIRRALLEFPKVSWVFLAMMQLHEVSDEDMILALPEIGTAYGAYGNYLMSAGKMVAAEQAFRSAVSFSKAEAKPNSATFLGAYKFFEQDGRYEEALQVMLAGIECFPTHAGFRRTAASLYERLGIPYRAIEEYRQSLLLDPKTSWVRKRLKQLEEGT
jgi:O-antigen ligase/Tfp pilus assembly protein PilF